MDKSCVKCGSIEVKLIPAGVSKTKLDQFGKPKAYNAFYKCGECGNIENTEPLNSAPKAKVAPQGARDEFREAFMMMAKKLDRIERKIDALAKYSGIEVPPEIEF